MAKYHLKEDGTAGPCTAAEGNCPKGEAIHGESVEDVYNQLEKVMKDQLFEAQKTPFESAPPRGSARDIGTGGMLLRTRQPFVIKQQLEGLRELGIIDEAIPTLEAYQPLVAGAVKAEQEHLVDFDKLYVAPEDYSYDGSDGGRYIGQTETWTSGASYELQTVALNHLMDKLERGELEGTNLDALGKALGHVEAPEEYPDKYKGGHAQQSFNFDYMAFNYNGQRQPDTFFNTLKNRLVQEGFSRKKTGANKHDYNVPAFLWKGLDTAARERFASRVLVNDLASWRGNSGTFQERVLGRDFGETMSATFAPNDDLRWAKGKEGEKVTFRLDHEGSKLEGTFTISDSGFQWTEHKREYVEPKPEPRF